MPIGKQRKVVAGLKEAIAYAKGDISAARVTRYDVPQNIDVAAPPDFALTPSERKKVFPKSRKDPVPRGYAAPPGSGPEGETCGSCRHHAERHYAKVYHKCVLMSDYWTFGGTTDIRVRSPACSRWERRDA